MRLLSPRALLSPAKVVLIDEATANVDGETDMQLQQVRVLTVLTGEEGIDIAMGVTQSKLHWQCSTLLPILNTL